MKTKQLQISSTNKFCCGHNFISFSDLCSDSSVSYKSNTKCVIIKRYEEKYFNCHSCLRLDE